MYEKVDIVSLGKTAMDKVDIMEKFLKDTRDECNLALMELAETERTLVHADLAGPIARLLAKKVADDRFHCVVSASRPSTLTHRVLTWSTGGDHYN